MKVCKVISTHFNHRKGRNRNDMLKIFGFGWPTHIQFDVDPKGVLSMVKDQISIETDVDAGVECDTIIVNGRAGFEEGDAYIRSINGQKTFSGQIFSIEMDNVGGQFGAYNLAYLMFADKYDYWMLDEDDIVITGYNYYKNLIERLEEGECYALIGLGRYTRRHKRLGTIFPPGSLLLMHRQVPEHLKRVDGELPHPKTNDFRSRVKYGEVGFSKRVIELGYKLVYKGKSKQNETVEWDYETDYCLPYREMIEKFGTVENFKQSGFYRG